MRSLLPHHRRRGGRPENGSGRPPRSPGPPPWGYQGTGPKPPPRWWILPAGVTPRKLAPTVGLLVFLVLMLKATADKMGPLPGQ